MPKSFFRKFSVLRDTHIQNFREGSSNVPTILLRPQHTHVSKSSQCGPCWEIRCLNPAGLKFLQYILIREKLFEALSLRFMTLLVAEVWTIFLEAYFSTKPHIIIYLVDNLASPVSCIQRGNKWLCMGPGNDRLLFLYIPADQPFSQPSLP